MPDVTFPDPTTFFQDNIERFIPEWYQSRFQGLLNLLGVTAPTLDELYQFIIDVPNLPDIDRTPAQFLQRLSENIGVLPTEDVFDETQTVAFRRQELGKLKDSHTIRSTEYSFLRLLKYLGATEYGLFYPWHNINFLDITPIDGWSPREEINDVGELLAPQTFDISFLCDGGFDMNGDLIGDRVIYTVPVNVIRSRVRLIWNNLEVEPGAQVTDENLGPRTFTFDKGNSTLVTNFIPLAGDTLTIIVAGDPFYRIAFRTEDAFYWRPGVTEVFADVSPLLRRKALEDRRPAGTLLYFAFLIVWLVTKCFPKPPAIDYTRNGYAPQLPPDEAATWDPGALCNAIDPLFFQILNGYGFEGIYEKTGDVSFGRMFPFSADEAEIGEFQINGADDDGPDPIDSEWGEGDWGSIPF